MIQSNKGGISWVRQQLSYEKKYWQLYLLISLPFLFILIFNYWPIYGIQIAFKDFDFKKGMFNSPWVGLKYFYQYFNSYQFWPTLRNTLLISGISIIVGFPIPIIFAIALNELKNITYKKIVQTVTYAPYFISTVVMVGIILQVLDTRTGPINQMLVAVGLNPVNFMAEPNYFIPIFILSGIWQYTGYSSIIYISALSGVDQEQQEAAIIDGATKLKRIWYIDIPHIIPTSIILLLLSVGTILNVDFQKIFLMQNALNLATSEVLATYVYKMGLRGAQYSFSSAIGLFSSIVSFVLLLAVNQFSKKATDISLF